MAEKMERKTSSLNARGNKIILQPSQIKTHEFTRRNLEIKQNLSSPSMVMEFRQQRG